MVRTDRKTQLTIAEDDAAHYVPFKRGDQPIGLQDDPRDHTRHWQETRVTEGEIEALHEDVNRVLQDAADLTMRVELLEGHRQ